jgi:hypothetical protein
LRELSDVFLGNPSDKHTASITRVFGAVPELRAAKSLPVGGSSQSEAGRNTNQNIWKDRVFNGEEEVDATQVLA